MDERSNQLARLQSQLQPGSLLAKVLNDLSPEDLAALRKKAAEGKLEQDLRSDERFQKLQLSAAEIELFMRNVKNLQQSVGLDPAARYQAQGQFEGATGSTRIEVRKGCFATILLLLALSLLTAVAPFAFSQSSAPAASSSGDEVIRLRAENDKLRGENQRLRQLLVQGGQPTAPVPPALVPVQRAVPVSSSSVTRTSTEAQGLSHWITSSSGKRHNSSCRWYRNSNGRAATATEGTACLKCGG